MLNRYVITKFVRRHDLREPKRSGGISHWNTTRRRINIFITFLRLQIILYILFSILTLTR